MFPHREPTTPYGILFGSLVLFLVLFALTLPQAITLPLLDRDEPRFSEATREMLQTKDFIIPHFNGVPRYDKPPLIYWCQAPAFLLLGQNELASRLPSLLATTGTALLLFLWSAWWRPPPQNGWKIGLLAAVAYACSLQVMLQGRVATADALLIFFMTLTVLSGWELGLLVGEGASFLRWRYTWYLFVFSLAFGFLAKGPEAWLPLLPLLIAVPKLQVKGRISLLLAFALSLVLVGAWGLPALMQSQGDFWRVGIGHHVVDRAWEADNQHGATNWFWYVLFLPLYFLTFWISFFPWTPFLLVYWRELKQAQPEARGTRWVDDFELYLVWNIGLIFLVFTLMVTKLPHYTLPAFPFLALLFARRWDTSGRYAMLPVGVGLAAALVLVFLFPALAQRDFQPSPVKNLVQQGWPALPPEAKFGLIDFQEPSAIWELRRRLTAMGELLPEDQALPFLNQHGLRVLLLPTDVWNGVSAQADPSWKVYQTKGWNAAKAKRVNLTLVVKAWW